MLLADLYQRERNIPAAHALLRDAVALYPRDLKLVKSLSWLELSRGNTPAAIAILEDGLKAVPEGFDSADSARGPARAAGRHGPDGGDPERLRAARPTRRR